MAVYSTSTYQACKPELADKTIFGIACKITDQAHSYDKNKLFSNLEHDLKQSFTVQVALQNNQMLNGHCFAKEFDYWSDTDNDFIPSHDLKQPESLSDHPCYLIMIYGFENNEKKAEIKTIDAEYTATRLYMVSQLNYALDFAHILLDLPFNNAVTITKTTTKNAQHQIDKRLNATDLLRPENNVLLEHAGDYWTDYRIYSSGKQLGHGSLSRNYTQEQAKQALGDYKELNPNIIYGCMLLNPKEQEAEYQEAIEFMQGLESNDKGNIPDKEHATWVIENYQHSQSIRQATANNVSTS